MSARVAAASGKIIGHQSVASSRLISRHARATSQRLFAVGSGETGTASTLERDSASIAVKADMLPVRAAGKTIGAIAHRRRKHTKAKKLLQRDIKRAKRLSDPALEGVIESAQQAWDRKSLLRVKPYRSAHKDLRDAVRQSRRAARQFQLSHSRVFGRATRAGLRAKRVYRDLKDASRAVRTTAAALNAARSVIVHVVTFVASAALSMVTTVLAPLIAVVVVFSLVVSLFTVVSHLFGSDTSSVGNVPSEYLDDVLRAGSICPTVTPQVIAAQLEAESGFNPRAASSAGAQGIAQFMPGTWSTHGKDGDGDSKADVWNAHDAIYSQGLYMCELAGLIERDLSSGKVKGDQLALTLAAYNAGIGNVEKAHGVPSFGETQGYVRRITERMSYFTGNQGGTIQVGEVAGKLGNCGEWQTFCYGHATGNTGNAYPPRNCTLWAYQRRVQLGLPVGSHMGNGAEWANSARRLGYTVNHTPAPGAIMVFQRGQAGTDPVYGHVAIVERVNADGSVYVSQGGIGFATFPFYETYQRASNFEYIHN
ncbi:hypothetical protein GCM10007377_12310 [Galliscardovia ingluviei]|uniref:Peptidase C51 domain-containing protein n=1 Tax=Galliscardovia ingluviei TaxID=1769422 RepID=A0A8J3EZR7_9BIFI|nr:CHAP domain-containing protein [Galliscardovia ingluviei]GGI14716.1 hypothetical protein GCM10007377_12310 [Galliscardovia ingluviei]